MKTAAVLVIGNELLSGKTRDCNLHYIACELRSAGVQLVLSLFVLDDVDEIADAIRYARDKAQVVITAGGVGPTHEDVTVRGMARALDRKLITDPALVKAVHEYYGDLVNDEVLSMAEVPRGVELLQPAPFFVPVFRLENVYAFPGVPQALRLLFAPWKESIRQDPYHLARCELNTDEAHIAPLLRRLQDAHPELEVGSYPRYDEGAPYRVLVTIEGKALEQVRAAANALIQQLRASFGEEALLRFEIPTACTADASE